MGKIGMILLGLLVTCHAWGGDFVMTSSAFANSSPIPITYTCDGKNISPPFTWSHAPPRTQSYVFIIFNPDAPFGTYYNWILYNIPKTVTSLREGANQYLPNGTQVGLTSSGDSIYRGPCPPNAAIHHYIFKMYALDTVLDLSDQVSSDEVFDAMKNHILAEAELVGLFNH